MSIRKRTWKNADGVESVRWIVDLMDANGHRERRQFESRKEADAFRLATENAMRAGTFRGDAAKFTVKDAADRFLEYCECRRKRGERMTQRNYDTMDGHIGNYICRDPKRHEGKVRPSRLKDFEGGIAGIKLAQLTTRGVADFRDRLRDAGVSVVTTRKILSTLQQILSYAIDRDMIGTNVARGVKVIGRRDEGARKIEPPTKEAMRALRAVADQDFRVKLAFASSTGVRAGDPQRHPAAPARFNWHALRHFAISCWIEADLSPKTVQTFAGHSSLQVTMDRYGHLFKSDDHKKAMDAIAADMFG